MLDQKVIGRYLEEVDRHLHVDRAHRQRVLDEMEGHLHDAVEAHVAHGTQPDDAVTRAIAELGPPVDVAMQFSPAPAPAPAVRGWRRWTPIVLPTAVLTTRVAAIAWLLLMLRHGLTYGLQRALWHDLRYTAVVGALTAATYVAIRNGDHDPAWRRAAWLFAALTGVLVAVSVAG